MGDSAIQPDALSDWHNGAKRRGPLAGGVKRAKPVSFELVDAAPWGDISEERSDVRIYLYLGYK